MKTAIAATLAIAAIAALLWIGGEVHRSNCYAAGHSTCSALPWESGEGQRGKLEVVTYEPTIQDEFDHFRQEP